MRKSILAIAVASCVLAGCNRPTAAPSPPAETLRFDAVSPNLLAQGERLSRVLGCRGCHGADATGRPWDEEPEIAISYTSNLTRAAARYDDSQLEHALRQGRRPDGSPLWGMPSELFTHLSENDMRALITWLRSLRPTGRDWPLIVFGPRGRAEVARREFLSAPDAVREARRIESARLDGRHEWARYMIRATCSECHGMDLSGQGQGTDHETPDLAIAGAYTRDQFRHLLRTGEPVGGRRLGLMGQVSRGRFAHLTAREVDAIHAYLQARAHAGDEP